MYLCLKGGLIMALYLAAHDPSDHPLNAFLFSWLNELNWFQEPSFLEISPALNLEIQEE